jgi:6-phospho-beta-glucosidase
MKIAIIGAAGVRTPLILQAVINRQERLGLTELALMDIDEERLELIGALTSPLEKSQHTKFKVIRTIDPILALTSADFVITTFRVGGIESRTIDERVPLNYSILGQETTGPGGFAMGMRSIPVLLDYIKLMRQVCPNAWLINFANPAGMLVEAAQQGDGWPRSVGICDSPSHMWRVAAAILEAQPEQINLDYFGLNHLGWIRSIIYHGEDRLPYLISLLQAAGGLPGLPFEPEWIASLGMIPNEYLFYYYNKIQAVQNILKAGQSRGEQIAALNIQLFNDLRKAYQNNDFSGMEAAYHAYLNQRGSTYMVRETGRDHHSGGLNPSLLEAVAGEGYAGVALDLIEALIGAHPKTMILNIPNRGSILGMDENDVVEIPAYVGYDKILPLAVGKIPGHCLGLIKQVKAYERLTIAAATEGSYSKALSALVIHPLVSDYESAKEILDEYRIKHGEFFPKLQ